MNHNAEPLRVSIVQMNIVWHDTKSNIDKVDKLIRSVDDSDLIVLPEMWNTGYTMQPEEVYVTMSSALVSHMRSWAAELDATIMGSVVIREDEHYFNRLLAVHPDQSIDAYDKRHLFTLAGENKVYTAGSQQSIIKVKGWKICPMICYDLRFPVWSRNASGYDLLLFVANWPSPRHYAWRNLLVARAIENISYVIGVNRVGTDQHGYTYLGGSSIIDYSGKRLIELESSETCRQLVLRRDPLLSFRKKFNFLADRDHFEIKY